MRVLIVAVDDEYKPVPVVPLGAACVAGAARKAVVATPKRAFNLVFATAAVGTYYWFKLPVVLGLEGDDAHALLELGSILPAWSTWVARGAIIGLLAWLLLGRGVKRGWTTRPPWDKAARQA